MCFTKYKRFVKYYQINEKKIKVIYHGNDFDNIKEDLKKRYQFKFQIFFVCWWKKTVQNFFLLLMFLKKISKYTMNLK